MSAPNPGQAAIRPSPFSPRVPGRAQGLFGLVIGLLALAAPFLPDKLAFLVLGLLILMVGLLQNVTGFALRDPKASGTWFSRGGASILTGLLLMAMPRLTFAALALLLGLSWIISGISAGVAALRQGEVWSVIDGLINVLLGLAIALQWPISGILSIGLWVGLRYVSLGWSLLLGASKAPIGAVKAGQPESILGIAPHPYLATLSEKLTGDLMISRRSDRSWTWIFLFTFFAIHASRMDTDWNLVGMLSPAGAVLGDAALAIVLAYGLIAPLSVSWRTMTRRVEQGAWGWYLSGVDQGKTAWGIRPVVGWWLTGRLRGAIGRNQARGSATAALGWGLQRGLPVAAVLMAVTPLWGVSWFFNTETWVTAGWEAWAERRTDHWREEMVKAVQQAYGDAGKDPAFFQIFPFHDDKGKPEDFSFIVIGDTGEGDASQHILRDQFLFLGQKPEVKFLVVSSDVIYPSGSMKDYEPKFYLPFKGFHKPIYAVPGNHDWYDALEAFNANMLEPKAARAALRARREADHRLTTTTEASIDAMVEEAGRLRQEYQVQAAQQRAPYFEMHTELFSLVVVDTGILRRIDEAQMLWLEEALGRGRGKFKMVLLGHPLYAAGRYQGHDDPDFTQIHLLLKKHAVDVVMAGDTHDFEFYKENNANDGSSRSMYHFVNGGGGAYLSIGTALSWPTKAPVEECGFYPRADALTASLGANTPTWKRPLWSWVKRFNAWPSSPEAVASAFNYDRAPFFQSFMEVRVEGSTNRVLYWLHGTNGRLRWRDLFIHEGKIPNGKGPDELVEFSFPLRIKGK